MFDCEITDMKAQVPVSFTLVLMKFVQVYSSNIVFRLSKFTQESCQQHMKSVVDLSFLYFLSLFARHEGSGFSG